jgi:hypothetical protein
MVTLTVLGADDGVRNVRVVGLPTFTDVACADPKLTFAPASKFVPLRVTVWPPLVEPVAGKTVEIIGGAAAFTVSVPLLRVTE